MATLEKWPCSINCDFTRAASYNGRCYQTHPMIMGAPLFAEAKRVRKGRRALRRRPLPATAGSRVRFRCHSRHCVPSRWCYLGTTTKAIARWYRAIVPREGRIPQSAWSDYTLVYSWPVIPQRSITTRIIITGQGTRNTARGGVRVLVIPRFTPSRGTGERITGQRQTSPHCSPRRGK